MREISLRQLNLMKKILVCGRGPLGIDNVYFDYFHGLALKGTGKNDEANVLFDRIANENFYGIGRALVRELAKSQI